MTNEEKATKYKAQRKEFYRAYGQFALEFQIMCEEILCCVIAIIKVGPTNGDAANTKLVSLTGGLLIKKFEDLYCTFYKSNELQIAHLKPLFEFLHALNLKRNDIIHGTWQIGFWEIDQIDFDWMIGFKHTSSKNGVVTKLLNYSSVTIT